MDKRGEQDHGEDAGESGSRRPGRAGIRRAGAALICLWTVAAAAQDQAAPPELPDVVVSASALPLTEASVNQHVSVYHREQIERAAPSSVSEFLARNSGVIIDRTPRSGGFGSMFLRGADPSHVVVLIDGIRQNDPLSSRGSAVDLNTLTLDDVERIELVRGGSSVVHGEALAGVVQIFTRAPRAGPPARANVEAGGQGLAAASAAVAGGPFRLGVSHREDGDSGTGFTRTRAANLAFREKWDATLLNAQIRLADSRNRGFPDDSGGRQFAVNRDLEDRQAELSQLAFALDHALSAHSALELRAARFQRDSTQRTPAVAPGLRDPFGLPAVDTEGRYQRSEFQLNWRWRAADGLDLLLGAGRQSEEGRLRSTIFLFEPGLPADFDIDRATSHVVAEARKSFGPWSAQLGLRHERTAGEDSLTHPAASLQYQLGKQLGSIGGAVSSGGKLPSFYALGNPLVGNPDLRPERSRQAEVYYASPETSPWRLRITLFTAHFRNLIDFEAGPPPRLVNRDSIRSKGIEFSVRRSWQKGLSFYTQGTLLDVSDPEDGPPLRFRPQRQASAGFDLQLAPQWRWHTELTYIGSRFDSSIPTGDVKLGGFSTLNLGLTWLGRNWQAFAAVDNALDHDGQESVGTPVPGRRLRLGLRWSL